MANLRGLESVIRNLNKQVQKIKGGSLDGLIDAAIIVRRDMDRTPPLIPIDRGKLRASWFVATINPKALLMGFTANYAPFVHESVGRTFKRPGAGAKFFEASIKRNKARMLKAIRDHAQIR